MRPELVRQFLDALIYEDDELGIDMDKAREIKREELRELREPLMHKADIAYMQADEEHSLARKMRVARYKKRLRDITNNPMIDKASTAQALAGVYPEVLNEACP